MMTEAIKKNGAKVGVVVSDAMDKTCVVKIERNVQDPVTGKYIRRSTKLHAHDENNACKNGDTVTIVPDRPRSKLKSWQVLNIVEKAR